MDNLQDLENEFLEQNHKLTLLEQVETSGFITGDQRTNLTDLNDFDTSYLPT